jgi:hypothetical protein
MKINKAPHILNLLYVSKELSLYTEYEARRAHGFGRVIEERRGDERASVHRIKIPVFLPLVR